MTSEDIRRRDFLLALGASVGLAGAGAIVLPPRRRIWQVGANLERADTYETVTVMGYTAAKEGDDEVTVRLKKAYTVNNTFMGDPYHQRQPYQWKNPEEARRAFDRMIGAIQRNELFISQTV